MQPVLPFLMAHLRLAGDPALRPDAQGGDSFPLRVRLLFESLQRLVETHRIAAPRRHRDPSGANDGNQKPAGQCPAHRLIAGLQSLLHPRHQALAVTGQKFRGQQADEERERDPPAHAPDAPGLGGAFHFRRPSAAPARHQSCHLFVREQPVERHHVIMLHGALCLDGLDDAGFVKLGSQPQRSERNWIFRIPTLPGNLDPIDPKMLHA